MAQLFSAARSRICAGRLVWLWCLGCALTGCTRDFSRFHFSPEAGVSKPHDAAQPAGDVVTNNAHDAASDAAFDAQADHDAGSATMDAAAAPRDAAEATNAHADAMPASSGDGATKVLSTDAMPLDDDAQAPNMPSDAQTPHDAQVPADAQTPHDAQTPPTRDAQTAPPDAQTSHDAGPPPDAQITPEQQACANQWSVAALSYNSASCIACACAHCTTPIVNCLSSGEDSANAACAAVVACALVQHCHGWDCYCSGVDCVPDTNNLADGPCHREMELAAGGDEDHARVALIRSYDTSDSDQPLLEAVHAIACVVGMQPDSMNGKCPNACAH
jgi:hypothetical protein